MRTANFNMVIISDLLGRGISLVVGGYFCKEVVLKCGKVERTAIWKEIWKNIISGSQLMFANLASSCIIGVVRYGIQKNWSVAIFGKVSLMLSLSNLFVIFINAMGIVIYPILRRTDNNKRNELYFANRQNIRCDIVFSFNLILSSQINYILVVTAVF